MQVKINKQRNFINKDTIKMAFKPNKGEKGDLQPNDFSSNKKNELLLNELVCPQTVRNKEFIWLEIAILNKNENML